MQSYEQNNGFSEVTTDELYFINGRSFSWSELGSAVAVGAVTGAMTGAADGTVVIPVVGTVAGATAVGAVGAVIGALVGAAGYFVSTMFD